MQSTDSASHGVLELVGIVLGALAIALLLRMFVFDVFIVPTGSMLPTIQLEDRLIGEKISYRFRSPEAGEVVTFISLEDNKTTLVKRVIATAGQTVSMQDGSLYINGVKKDEPYTHGTVTEPLSSSIANIEYPYTVPDGYVWVMGDNRTNSLDSRYFGPVPISRITSRCVCIFWPLSDMSSL